MSVAIPEPLALVLQLVVDGLTWVVRDVRDPVGQARRRQGFRDARAGAQILTRDLRLLEGHLRLADRLELLALAGLVVASAARGDDKTNSNSGNEEWQDLADADHSSSIAPARLLVTSPRYSTAK
jgi:hypothetical protein